MSQLLQIILDNDDIPINVRSNHGDIRLASITRHSYEQTNGQWRLIAWIDHHQYIVTPWADFRPVEIANANLVAIEMHCRSGWAYMEGQRAVERFNLGVAD